MILQQKWVGLRPRGWLAGEGEVQCFDLQMATETELQVEEEDLADDIFSKAMLQLQVIHQTLVGGEKLLCFQTMFWAHKQCLNVWGCKQCYDMIAKWYKNCV